jgi:hypothetical protein
MQSSSRTIRRTALAAALTLAVAGSGAASAIASPPPVDAGTPSIERTIGDELKPATAKEEREIQRQARHAAKRGDVAEARTTKRGAKKQSRWYVPLGCIYFSDASICGYDAYFDVSYVINWYGGGTTLGWMPTSWWNTLVYYYG